MSGGCYDYTYSKLAEIAQSIHVEPGCKDYCKSTKILRKAFKKHLEHVVNALRAIEWNDSGDGDKDEVKYIKQCISPSAELEVATEEAKEALKQLQEVLENVK